MSSKQKSILFWIIFLAIVAVIAYMIFPKYGALSSELGATKARNIASNLTASSAANYTQRKANASSGIAVKNCVDVANIGGNGLPEGYQITNQAIEADKVALCTLNGPRVSAIQFSVIGIN